MAIRLELSLGGLNVAGAYIEKCVYLLVGQKPHVLRVV